MRCAALCLSDEGWTLTLHQSHLSLQHPCFLQARALQVNRSFRAGWSTELISALGAFLHLEPPFASTGVICEQTEVYYQKTYPQLVSQL